MAVSTFVRARIDGALRDEAAAVLATMGLTVSDLLRITLTRVAREKALPFEMRAPNRRTARTLAKSERGQDLRYCENAQALFKELGI